VELEPNTPEYPEKLGAANAEDSVKHDSPRAPDFGEFAFENFLHAMKIAIVLLAHVVVASIVLLTIYVIEAIFHSFWPLQEHEPKLFDMWPLKYLFHTMDAAVVAIFVVFSMLQVISVFRGK
jgi:hypothetical protein